MQHDYDNITKLQQNPQMLLSVILAHAWHIFWSLDELDWQLLGALIEIIR